MKRLRHILILFFLGSSLALTQLSLAQNVKRIVVLPFEAFGGAEPYALGLPTALARSLNAIDGVYVPSVGDTVIVTQRLNSMQQLNEANVIENYNASALVSGRVAYNGNSASIQIGISGNDYPSTDDIFLTGDITQANTLIAQAVNALIEKLALPLTDADRSEVASILSQTPSLPSLRATSLAASQLVPVRTSDLEAAASLDGNSSWVRAELARSYSLAGQDAKASENAKRAVELAPSDIEANVVEGIILQNRGDESSALAAFNRALALNPNHALALVGRAGLSKNDPAQAMRDYEAAIVAAPRLDSAYMGLAGLQIAQNDNRALQTLRNGANKLPESFVLHNAVISEAVRLNDPQGAVAYIRQVAAQENSAELYRLVLALPESNFNDALAIVREGASRFPNEAAPILTEATLYARQGQDDAAISTLQRGLSVAPDNADVVNQLAVAYAKSGNLEAAKQAIEGSGANISAPMVRYNLAQIYLEAGQNQEAVTVLDSIQEYFLNDVEFLTLYGIALGRVGESARALNLLDRALSLNPNANTAAEVKRQLESLSGAVQSNATVSSNAGNLSAEQNALISAAVEALNRGDAASAASQFSQARALGDSPELAFYHANALQANGQPEAALAGYEIAIAAIKDNDSVYNNAGYAYYSVGNYLKALEYLQRATELNPSNANAQLNYGLVNFSLGRFAKAVPPLERALALDPALANIKVNLPSAGLSLTLQEMLNNARQSSGN